MGTLLSVQTFYKSKIKIYMCTMYIIYTHSVNTHYVYIHIYLYTLKKGRIQFAAFTVELSVYTLQWHAEKIWVVIRVRDILIQ